MANKNNKTSGRAKSSGGVKKAPTKKTSKPKAKTTTNKKTETNKKTTKRIPKTKSPDYVRISENSQASKFKEMGERIQRGEIKWSFYGIDGNVGYHYYLKLK
jgi:hypothetical protein